MKDYIGKYVPLVLGALFIYSGVYKLIRPGEATYALVSLDLPPWIAVGSVMAATAIELYLGLILLFRTDLKIGLTVATIVVLAFTIFLWYLSTMAHPPSCGCLGLTGMFTSTKQAAVFGVARNCAILWGLKLAYDYYIKPTSISESGNTPNPTLPT